MKIKRSQLADEIVSEWEREKYFKRLAKLKKQKKDIEKEEQNSIK